MRRRTAVLLACLICAAGVGLALFLVLSVDRRTDAEKVRDACADLLEACLARDFEAVWELSSGTFQAKVHEVFEAVRTGNEYEAEGLTWTFTPDPPDESWEGIGDEDLFVRETREWLETKGPGTPEEPSGAAPWLLPGALLRELFVEEVVFEKGCARATMGFRRAEHGKVMFEPAVFALVAEEGQWRFLSCELSWTSLLPPVPEPPDHRVEGPELTITLRSGRSPPDVQQLLSQLPRPPESRALVVRSEEGLPWSDVVSAVALAAAGQVRALELRIYTPPSRRELHHSKVDSVYQTHVSFPGFRTISTASLPLSRDAPPAESVDLIVTPGPGSPFLEGLREWLDWLMKRDEDLVVLVDPHPDLPSDRVIAVLDVLDNPGVKRLLLTTPAKQPGPVPKALLLNGRPLTELGGSTLPPVPEDHPALDRILRWHRTDSGRRRR